MKLVSLFALLAIGTGCNVLKDEKDNKKSGTQQCQVRDNSTAKKNIPEAEGNAGNEAADNDVADSAASSADEENLPFNQSAAMALLKMVMPDDGNVLPPDEDRPEPRPKPVDPTEPYPTDECRLENLPNSQTPVNPTNPVGKNPPEQDPDQCNKVDDIPEADLLDRAEPSEGAVEAPPAKVFAVCASDATKTKNVPASGSNPDLKLDWQVLDGLLVYEDARRQCADKGEDWHLAEPAELEKLLQLPEFQKPVESECTTSFWSAGARDRGNQCVAPYVGFRYTGSQNDPLPINNTINAQNFSGVDAVLTKHSVMCVKGGLKPTVSCGEAAKTFFQQRPLGVKDAKGALTWAKITVKNFSNAAEVEKQCDSGKAAGWRMPTKAEVEVAVESDLFKTAVYGGLDPTCPQLWHKPDDAITNITCGSLATGKDGAAVFSTDSSCGGAQVFGLCVQDIK